MKATIVGATGFIGVPLCKELKSHGWDITVLVRNQSSAEQALGPGYTIIPWVPHDEVPQEALQEADVVINLAGESIGAKRWTQERKARILSSRVIITRKLVDAMRRLERKPEALINASAIGYYGPRHDEKLCEDTEHGTDFLAIVCRAWEEEATDAEKLGIRVVRVRIGVVLGEGGALARMVTPFKLFAGGPVGSGRQWFSWVHRDDLIGIIRFCTENRSISGPVNATAPNPVTMGEFSKILGKVLGRPSWLPVPAPILKTALGEMSNMLLDGQRIIPCKALEAGYSFKYEDAESALRDILSR